MFDFLWFRRLIVIRKWFPLPHAPPNLRSIRRLPMKMKSKTVRIIAAIVVFCLLAIGLALAW